MGDREIYLGLAQKLNYPLTERFECLLRKIMTPQEALMLVESPAPSEELGAKTGMSAAAVDAKLHELMERGLLISTRKGYFAPRAMGQFHDASLSSASKYVDREMLDLWEDFSANEFYKVYSDRLVALPSAHVRTVAHRDAIAGIEGVQPYEDIEAIVASGNRWSVVPCTCRLKSHKCDLPVNVCLQMNRAAEYSVARGAGKDITKEEALAVIKQSADAGLIHQLPNRDADFGVICNCCTDCCIIFRPLFEHHPDEVEKGYAKSRFEATIDVDECTGCQTCIDRCQLGAIEMQKVAGYKKMKAVVDGAKCWGCGACVTGCPDKVATLKLVRPLEYIPSAAAAH